MEFGVKPHSSVNMVSNPKQRPYEHNKCVSSDEGCYSEADIFCDFVCEYKVCFCECSLEPSFSLDKLAASIVLVTRRNHTH